MTSGLCENTCKLSGPIFQKEAFLKFVRHFLVEFVMQLFSHNSDMLIPNLPHAKLYFEFFPFKIAKQNGRQNIR